jgi:hypothetical protein
MAPGGLLLGKKNIGEDGRKEQGIAGKVDRPIQAKRLAFIN